MIERRSFLAAGSAFVACPLLARAGGAADEKPVVRFGLITDTHYADIPDANWGDTRCYRAGLDKVSAAVKAFGELKCDFAIELGDLKDLTRDAAGTLATLDAVEKRFAAFKGDVYHVCGNHDFDCISSAEFFAHIRNAGKVPTCGYYAFDRGGIRFVVLDACYTSDLRHYERGNPWMDTNVPPEELAWLRETLASSKGPAVVFVHQLLEPSVARPGHMVKNHAAVRDVLERSRKVKTVFTGHQHEGVQSVAGGIVYYGLKAQTNGRGPGSNSYAVASVFADGTASVTGYERANSRPRPA